MSTDPDLELLTVQLIAALDREQRLRETCEVALHELDRGRFSLARELLRRTLAEVPGPE